MPPEFCQMVYNLPIFKVLFPSLNDLAFADIAQHLIPLLDRLQFVPQHVSIWGNKIGQPLKQNIITVNQETSSTKRTKTSILQTKEHQLKET